ncbi:EAL domain-containing protein [Sneathiella sp. P13V-1]|uniref:putative bifunctional diguanylate cyclase/phosphodiesterase n=1 Tax=Sneathiella sp. P13V-1 TaxID=2697366 RepID=UPI00187BBBB7|nr:bifunctional diguanylate cyclase/phosphodiesterase [Sneathiella sp. P13V-1]MBE7638295.1 EAL domain-containing protein [Sneathiella sp. P13V-1]
MASVLESLSDQAQNSNEAGTAEKLLKALSVMQACRGTRQFCNITLQQLTHIYPHIEFSAFLRSPEEGRPFEVVARLGGLGGSLQKSQLELLRKALSEGATLYKGGDAAICLMREEIVLGALFLTSSEVWKEEDKSLLEQFSINASRGFETTNILQEAENLAFHDALTQLDNRVSFKKTLAREISRFAQGEEQPLAVVQFVLDNLPELNIALGYSVGDDLLRITAQKLHELFPMALSIARSSGNGFAICIPVSENTNLADIPRRINELFDVILPEDYQMPHLALRMGISYFPDDGKTADRLWKNTSTALANTRRMHNGNYCFYDSEIEQEIHGRVTLNKALRDGMNQQELSLNYQPQICLQTGEMIGVEALLRWEKEEGKYIPADVFIPIAEASGLLGPISEWVLREACLQRMEWTKAGVPEFPVAVNISLNEFQAEDFVPQVSRALSETGLPASLLHIELTESVIMHDSGQTRKNMLKLKELGISLCIDDFGTGYSSLSYLSQLPASILKIDKSFIDGVISNENDAAIAMTIISLGFNLGMRVLAEGVESSDQVRFLKKAGCHDAQGYVFSKPVIAEKIPAIASVQNHLLTIA